MCVHFCSQKTYVGLKLNISEQRRELDGLKSASLEMSWFQNPGALVSGHIWICHYKQTSSHSTIKLGLTFEEAVSWDKCQSWITK